MLSSLSRGYGTWDGGVDTHVPFPPQEPDESQHWGHRHGVTVSPRSRYGHRVVQVAEDGKLEMPKTFATRKGALMLFTAPDDLPKEVQPSPRPMKRRRRRQKDVLDLSLKLKTLERLSLSVLQFGDKLYEKDTSSISDKDSKLMFSFLHELSQQEDDSDLHSQPGGDLKFYLRDLKRRASCRGYGTGGDTTPHKMRSAELQDLLDELEQVWPKYGGSRSHRDSTFTSSHAGDDYFHPSSPTPSITSTRSFSRAKVLSSHKLTASIKSLNQAGRSPSTDLTEPDARSVISDSPLITGATFGRSQRSKSAMWLSETSSPAYHLAMAARPGTSHSGKSLPAKRTQMQQDDQRKLMTSPAPSEEVSRKQPVWVEVESQPDAMSFMSEDGKSSFVSGPESELRSSDKGRATTPVRSERVMTPSRGDRDAMLMEAASVLSSLVEEEDLDIPVDDVTDIEEERDEMQWPGQSVQEEGRRTATPIRSKTPSSKPGDSVVQPLQPPYTGVMQGEDEEPQDLHSTTQHDILVQMRDASTEPEDVASLADQRAHSRTSTITPAPRSDTPATLGGHSEQMIQQVSDMMAGAEGARPLSGHGSATSGVKATADPDTLVGMMGKEGVADSGVSMEKPSSAERLAMRIKTPTPTPPSPTKAAPSPPPASTASASPPPPPPPSAALSVEPKSVVDQGTQPTPREDKPEEVDEIDFQLIEDLGPKRRVVIEDVSPRLDEGNAQEEEGGETEEDDGSGLSQRVRRERQEREERLAKQKEEKERAEAEKRSEEENKKQAAEDKRRAAEERLKAKQEEAQRRKEEEALLKAQAPPEPAEEAPKKTKGKKGKADKAATDKAGEKKEDKPAEETTKTGLDALEKLKSANKEVDLPMDKIKDFMDSQKKQPAVKEKEEADIPEHMKEMFARRSDSQVQEALEEEISKMRVAADNVLSESVLQPEEGEDGLSAEDFEAAQEALREKMKKAEEQMMGVVAPPSPPPVRKPVPAKGKGKSDKKGSPTRKKKGPEMSEAAKEKEAAKERKRMEKQKRLEEVMELQKKIKEKEDIRKTKEAEAKRQAEELEERMDEVRREEEELEQAENDAREQLQAVRKIQREEREARRKQDLEKKKQDAINKREKEKAMIDEARRKEQEMLDRIADSEMARRLRDEEDAKREEEELLAQERFENEMKEAQRMAEEEEERLRELERQAEDEAFQKLMEEKEAAEEKRWQLELEARRMREEEEKAREKLLEEEKRLEEEQKQKEAEEEARREEERERLRELQRLEEEARSKMRAELDKRRVWAMKRREYNLEQRANLDAIKQSQGITEPWTFSYYVRWPKESYHRPMGQSSKKKTGAPRIKPKAPAGQGSNAAPSAVDVSAVPK